MCFLLSLVMTSFVGTLLWVIEKGVKPITQKIFSQTWHYYASLIPVFFLLGASKAINILIDVIGSVLINRDVGLIQSSTKISGELFYLTEIKQHLNITSPVNQVFTMLSQYEYISEITMCIIFIWAVGVFIFLAVNIKSYIKFKHFILQNHVVCNTIQSTAKVIISANAKSPMVMGFLNPLIILPDVQFNEKELTMILSHELTHIKRGDLMIKMVVMITKAIHWFNPSIYFISRQINSYCELSCDEKVVQNIDKESRKSYGEMILTMLDYGVNKRNRIDIACICNLSNTKNDIKRRLLNIMNEKKMKRSVIVLSIFSIVMLVGVGTVTANSYASQVPEEIQLQAVHDDPVIQEKEDNDTNKLTIEIDVPHRMKYQDSYADLNIDIQPGKQLLTGDEAEAYLRYRRPN